MLKNIYNFVRVLNFPNLKLRNLQVVLKWGLPILLVRVND